MGTTLRCVSFALAAGLIAAPPARAQVRHGDHTHADPHSHGRGHVAGVLEATRTLVNELEHLLEHAAELREHRGFYRQADTVLHDAKHFRDSLKEGVSREHLYRDYERMDRKLHALLDAGRKLGEHHRPVARDLARIHQADQQVHYAISHGDKAPERRTQVIRRQGEALAAEARQFHRLAHAVLDEGQHIAGSVEKFAQAAEHFHKSLHGREDLEHLRRDFAAVDRAWHHIVRDFRALPPQQHAYLMSRAQRVDEIHARLFEALGMQGERQSIVIRVDRRDPAR